MSDKNCIKLWLRNSNFISNLIVCKIKIQDRE